MTTKGTIREDGFVCRAQNLEAAVKLLRETSSAVEAGGIKGRESLAGRFESIEGAFNSREMLLAVIGEFSRGKSTLVNVLLGMDLLPTALQVTTAVNTFIKQRPPDMERPTLRIHFRDGTPTRVVEWTTHTLKELGTELDRDSHDLRRNIERIEAFTDHPILEQGLVIIDTPGLESVEPHHEGITLEAIDHAHVAIWLQTSEQLGGNRREWDFANKTLRANFQKFLTVVTHWSKVLESVEENKDPTIDSSNRQKVRDEFLRNVGSFGEDTARTLIDERHLFFVDSKWATSAEASKRRKSNIEALSRRLEDICTGREAQVAMIGSPLQKLAGIQVQAIKDLQEELELLGRSDDTRRLEEDRARFELEVRRIEMDRDRAQLSSKEEHDRAARAKAAALGDLVRPLRELKPLLEEELTLEFVAGEIERGATKVELPKAVVVQYAEEMAAFQKGWERFRRELEEDLAALREDFEDQMSQTAEAVRKSLSGTIVEIPPLELKLDIDLGPIEEFHNRRIKLEQERAKLEQVIEDTRNLVSETQDKTKEVEEQKAVVARVEARLDRTGSPPPPTIRQRRVKEPGGAWSRDKYVTYDEVDDSNVKEWKEKRKELESELRRREEELQKIVRESWEAERKRVSGEEALRKYQRKHAEREKAIEKLEQEARAKREALAVKTLRVLQRNSLVRLDAIVKEVEGAVAGSIQKLFDDQVRMLVDAVNEHYGEPLKVKQNSLAETVKLIGEGKGAVEKRQASIQGALAALESLQKDVVFLMQSIENA